MSEDTVSGVSEDPHFQEWKTCQEAMMSLDKMILDIRKYGFTLITLLLTAQGFLLGETAPGNIVVLGIYSALLVLILGLFRVDRMHEVFLRATVLRAMHLEELLRLCLTRSVSYWSEVCRTATWGVWIYVFFAVAACTLSIGAIYHKPTEVVSKVYLLSAADTSSVGPHTQLREVIELDWLGTLASLLVLIGILRVMYKYHTSTKLSTAKRKSFDKDDPFREHIEASCECWRLYLRNE